MAQFSKNKLYILCLSGKSGKTKSLAIALFNSALLPKTWETGILIELDLDKKKFKNSTGSVANLFEKLVQ